jgi:hypothetical protein
LLIEPLGNLGGNSESRADLMKVASILKTLGWKNAGARDYKGTKQKVWCRCDTPKHILDRRLSSVATVYEVFSRPCTSINQQLSFQPSENSERSKEVSINSALSDIKPQINQASVAATATSKESEKSSTVTIVDGDKEHDLQICDANGLPIVIGDMIQPSSDDQNPITIKICKRFAQLRDKHPLVESNPVMKVIWIDKMDLEQGRLEIVVVAKSVCCWIQEQFCFYLLYNPNQIERNRVICQGFHKMISQGGQWNREAQTEIITTEEKKYLQVCDRALIPLAVGDIVQKFGKQSTGLAGIIFAICFLGTF